VALIWETVRREFYCDGSWRDIYVFDTNMAAWQRMLDAFRASPCQVQYFRDHQPAELPKQATDAFPLPDECNRMLSVIFSGVTANCHFFTENDIEFDIDPREIKGQEELDALLEFMHRLANIVGKDAVMTPENMRKIVVFRVRPGNQPVEWHECGGWT